MEAQLQKARTGEPTGIDHALLERYGAIPVPRYTSYPPANHWESKFGELEARETFRTAGARAASLYVHVPFCRKLCYYCGCNMLVTRSDSLVERYLQALELELDRVAALLPSRPGGSSSFTWAAVRPPTSIPDQLARLADAIQARFPWKPGIEARSRSTRRSLASSRSGPSPGSASTGSAWASRTSTRPSRSASTASSRSRDPGPHRGEPGARLRQRQRGLRVRAPAPDRRALPAHARPRRAAPPGPHRPLRLRPRSVDEEAPGALREGGAPRPGRFGSPCSSPRSSGSSPPATSTSGWTTSR